MRLIKFSIAMLALMLTVVSVEAKQKFVASDSSIYTKICVTAASSKKKALQLVSESRIEKNLVTCNGMSLDVFADKANTPLIFKLAVGADQSSATEVCLAATRTTEELMTTTESLYQTNPGKIESIVCNDIPLVDFASQHGVELITQR